MYKPLAVFIGLRYTHARRRRQFVSFVSLISLLSMFLGVFSLVVMTSVMNGFERELRGRILSVLPHVYVDAPGGAMENWQQWADRIAKDSHITGVAPYISSHVMLSTASGIRAAKITAIEPQLERRVSVIDAHIQQGSITDLQPGRYQIVLGSLLAHYLGVGIGDDVVVILPQVSVTPAGVFPRQKRFQVAAIFEVGAQVDAEAAFIHLADGQRLFHKKELVQGVRIQLIDLFSAPEFARKLAKSLPDTFEVKDWSETQGSLFRAVKMEKRLVALLLAAVVAIAAFNIVSILTMMVADKRADVAVLRTMGASPRIVMTVFLIQGMTLGLVGVGLGVALGVPMAINIGDVIAWLEQLTGFTVFDPRVYFISYVPSELQWFDVGMVALGGLLLSLLATLYPAYRAARIHPAEALRYE